MRYIYCARNGVHIIDLCRPRLHEQRTSGLVLLQRQALLFAAAKKQASEVVALSCTLWSLLCEPALVGRHAHQLDHHEGPDRRLKDLERMESSGAIAMRPKKEGAVLRRELERLQKYLGGLKNMRRYPTW